MKLIVVIAAEPQRNETGQLMPGHRSLLNAYWQNDRGEQVAGVVSAQEVLAVLESSRAFLLSQIQLNPPSGITLAQRVPAEVGH